MKKTQVLAMALVLLPAGFAAAQEDADGCKDHPMFTRFPAMHLYDCKKLQFDMRAFPVGAVGENQTAKVVEIEGPVEWYAYRMKDDAKPVSGLQIMRNFENAAKKAGATIEGRYPGWCTGNYDTERMADMGNGCLSNGLTMKLTRGGKETWVFLQASEEDGEYALTISERAVMKQEIAVNELVDKLAKDGFVTLYVNFQTGKATIEPASAQTLDAAAAALAASGEIRVEVAGHTDNVGSPEANLKLSEERAKAVMAALVSRGIPAARLAAKGYGQTTPIADNRTEEGRAKNRRVELVKK
jgi:outer membrane protein OmpA-like peptidoglycan-associated protein